MRNLSGLGISLLLLILGFSSCDSKKNTWLNRNWQNMNARFNGYFHAGVKMDESLQQLKASHVDDFRKILDVFPYGDENQAKAVQGNMEEIFKKASFIVQKYPISKWVDENYLLIAQSYLFRRDYYAAIESFQFILNRYKNNEIRYETEMWLLRTYYMQGKYDEAEGYISQVKNIEGGFPKHLKPELFATYAAIYIKQQKYPKAIEYLELAVKDIKNKDKRIRWNFILGQLYLTQSKPKTATKHFRKVIKYNPPYDYAFHSKMNIARSVNRKDKEGIRDAKAFLRRMLRDDKNVNFLDQIYYELGNLELLEKNNAEAIRNYELSVRNSTENASQKAISFLSLGNLYFEIPNYTLAQAYYDSAVNSLPTDFENYSYIVNKRNKLSDLIGNLLIVHDQDSLMKIASLPKEQMDEYIKNLAAAEKKKAEEDKKQQEQNQKNQNNPQGVQVPVANVPVIGNKFYFYNDVALAKGKMEFRQRWGERKLKDNWRISALSTGSGPGEGTPADTGDEESVFTTSEPDLKKYYEALPLTEKQKEESRAKVADALYNIGNIYYEQLADYKEAVQAYETLLSRFPDYKEKPRVLYNLFKIYTEHRRNAEKAAAIKDQLNAEFPISDFTKLLNNEKLVNKDATVEKEIQAYYSNMYSKFTEKNYAEVKRLKKEADSKYPGNYIQAKFDLLYAVAVGYTDTVTEYQKALQAVVNNYPGSDEAIAAAQYLESINDALNPDSEKKKKESPFSYAPSEEHYYMLVLPAGAEVTAAKVALSDYLAANNMADMEMTSLLLKNINRNIILIKPFTDKKESMKFSSNLQKNDDLLKKISASAAEHFVISRSNFGILLNNPDLVEYLDFYRYYYGK